MLPWSLQREVDCPRPAPEFGGQLLQTIPMAHGKIDLLGGSQVLPPGESHCSQPSRHEDLQLGRSASQATVPVECDPPLCRHDGHPLDVQGTRRQLGDIRVPWVDDVLAYVAEQLAET